MHSTEYTSLFAVRKSQSAASSEIPKQFLQCFKQYICFSCNSFCYILKKTLKSIVIVQRPQHICTFKYLNMPLCGTYS